MHATCAACHRPVVAAPTANYSFYSEPTTRTSSCLSTGLLYRHLTKATGYGLVHYEQDWLSRSAAEHTVNSPVRSPGMPSRRAVMSVRFACAPLMPPSVVSQWLTAMAQAAAALNISVQYDMPFPSHLMQSTAYPIVMQGSSRIDYQARAMPREPLSRTACFVCSWLTAGRRTAPRQPGNMQWQEGFSNLLFWAVGLIPWKDTFWTTTEEACAGRWRACARAARASANRALSYAQSDCPPAYGRCYEPNPELQLLVAVLSTGPSHRCAQGGGAVRARLCGANGRAAAATRSGGSTAACSRRRSAATAPS